MRRKMYKCSNPACAITINEEKVMKRGNGCGCGGKTPRVLRCPVCGGILGRVMPPESYKL